jgi:hypothetical protein
MMQAALHSTPGARDVLLTQVRAVGLALRRPAIVATALVAVATLLMTAEVLGGEVIEFHPEHQVLPGMLGLLLPIGVWMGEERFGAGFLWTLPVDRRWHGLAKVFAGWVWLMAAVALFVLWLLAITFLSGGTVFTEETRRVLPSFSFATSTFDPSAVQDVRWTPEPLLWLVPLTAATGTYLLASALALGTRHPLRWILASLPGLFVFAFAFAAANSRINGPDPVLDALFYGPYGVDALLTARTESLQVGATLSTGERVVVWRALPDVSQWATATLLWTGAGLVALGAAACRHRECR